MERIHGTFYMVIFNIFLIFIHRRLHWEFNRMVLDKHLVIGESVEQPSLDLVRPHI